MSPLARRFQLARRAVPPPCHPCPTVSAAAGGCGTGAAPTPRPALTAVRARSWFFVVEGGAVEIYISILGLSLLVLNCYWFVQVDAPAKLLSPMPTPASAHDRPPPHQHTT